MDLDDMLSNRPTARDVRQIVWINDELRMLETNGYGRGAYAEHLRAERERLQGG